MKMRTRTDQVISRLEKKAGGRAENLKKEVWKFSV
jgi:hypothetical protein